ncbi:MAG: V-type ATP synthase subunit F [Clostridia bacterium]|nr:V-type ATP synthase subunit F [Clostridia bacterium]
MYKGVAVIGDRDSIYGFSSIGLSIFPVSDREDGLEKFRQLCRGDYAVIYITEALAAEIEEEIEKVSESMCPAVILIPGVFGNTGRGKAQVRKSVEKAVGSDILFGGEK